MPPSLRPLYPSSTGYYGHCKGVLASQAARAAVVNEVRGAVLLPGNQLVSWSKDSLLRLWDLSSGVCIRVFSGHTGGIREALLLSDSRTLVSCSGDATLRSWNLASGACLGVLHGHTGAVRGALLLPGGLGLLSWAHDGTQRIWDVPVSACSRVLRLHDGADVWGAVLLSDSRTLVTHSVDSTLRTWDTTSWVCQRVFAGHAGRVMGVLALREDCQLLSWASDGTLRLWDIASAECLTTMQASGSIVYQALSISDDSSAVVSCSTDANLQVWDPSSGALLRTLKGHDSIVQRILPFAGPSRALSCSFDCSLRVWDAVSGRCVCVLEGHAGPVLGALAHPDGKTVVSWSNDGTLRVWDVTAPAPTRPLSREWNGILALADRTTVLAWSRDTVAVLQPDAAHYSLQTLQLPLDASMLVKDILRLPEGSSFVLQLEAFLPRRVSRLQLWNAASRALLHTFVCDAAELLGAEILSDGRTLAAVSSTAIYNWDIASGALMLTVPVSTLASELPPLSALLATPADLQARDAWATFLANTATVRLHHGAVLAQSASAPSASHRSRAQPCLISGMCSIVSGASSVARLKNVLCGTPTPGPVLDAPFSLSDFSEHRDAVGLSAQLLADGRWLASWTAAGVIRLWDSLSGACQHTLACAGGIAGALLLPENCSFVVWTTAGTLLLWDLADGGARAAPAAAAAPAASAAAVAPAASAAAAAPTVSGGRRGWSSSEPAAPSFSIELDSPLQVCTSIMIAGQPCIVGFSRDGIMHVLEVAGRR